MGRAWGRLYAGTRYHRKLRQVQVACPDSWWVWYPMIEMALEVDHDGFISDPNCPPFSLKQLASELKIRSVLQLEKAIKAMTDWSLLETRQGHIRLLSYNDRQFASDQSNERVSKYRKSLDSVTLPERYSNGEGERYGNGNVTPRTEHSITEHNITEENIYTPHPISSSSGFDNFWKIYPRKIARAAAEKAWNNLTKKRQLPEISKILSAIQSQSLSEQWQESGGKFIPHPATWLNQGRWDDTLEVQQLSDKPPIRPDPQCKQCKGSGFLDATDNNGGKVGLKKCSCWGNHESKI